MNALLKSHYQEIKLADLLFKDIRQVECDVRKEKLKLQTQMNQRKNHHHTTNNKAGPEFWPLKQEA